MGVILWLLLGLIVYLTMAIICLQTKKMENNPIPYSIPSYASFIELHIEKESRYVR